MGVVFCPSVTADVTAALPLAAVLRALRLLVAFLRWNPKAVLSITGEEITGLHAAVIFGAALLQFRWVQDISRITGHLHAEGHTAVLSAASSGIRFRRMWRPVPSAVVRTAGGFATLLCAGTCFVGLANLLIGATHKAAILERTTAGLIATLCIAGACVAVIAGVGHKASAAVMQLAGGQTALLIAGSFQRLDPELWNVSLRTGPSVTCGTSCAEFRGDGQTWYQDQAGKLHSGPSSAAVRGAQRRMGAAPPQNLETSAASRS